MDAPCRDCTDRHYNCHSECDKYIAYRKEREQKYAERKRSADVDFMINELGGSRGKRLKGYNRDLNKRRKNNEK